MTNTITKITFDGDEYEVGTSYTAGTRINIGYSYGNGGAGFGFIGGISNVIIENKVRTAQEVADYYNQTKGNYGL